MGLVYSRVSLNVLTCLSLQKYDRWRAKHFLKSFVNDTYINLLLALFFPVYFLTPGIEH